MRGPWQAVPSRLLPNLTSSVGLPFEALDLTIISIAGRVRNALVTTEGFNTIYSNLCNFIQGPDSTFFVPNPDWLSNSIIMGSKRAIDTVTNHASDIIVEFNAFEPANLFNLQSKLYKALHPDGKFLTLDSVLLARMSKWLPNCITLPRSVLDTTLHAADCIRFIAKQYKPCITFAVMKWNMDALCTSSRFHKDILECPLCWTFCGDRLDHIACCDFLQVAASLFWGRPILFSRLLISSFEFESTQLRGDSVGLVALHAYACLKTYNHARVSGSSSVTFYQSVIVHICLTCMASKRLVQLYRNQDLPRPSMMNS